MDIRVIALPLREVSLNSMPFFKNRTKFYQLYDSHKLKVGSKIEMPKQHTHIYEENIG